jgi:hypothetical protein
MNEPDSNGTKTDTGEAKPQRSDAVFRGLSVLALCIAATFLFYETGLNDFVSFRGHPHGLPAGPFLGWLIAWAAGWGFIRILVLVAANQPCGGLKRGPVWVVSSMIVLGLILASGF